MSYRVEWRLRRLGENGKVGWTYRFVQVPNGEAAKGSALLLVNKAYAGEFRIDVDVLDVAKTVITGVAEIVQWLPSVSVLPRPSINCLWADDDAKTTARWRVYAAISAALDEAAMLHLASRKDCRLITIQLKALLLIISGD